MEKIKLIALDLDGTLTNEDKVITPVTFNALMELQRKGVRLCLASGRPPYGMRPLAEQLQMDKFNGILLCYNGGHVELCNTAETIVEIKLNEEYLQTLYDFQNESGFALMTYYENHIYTEFPEDKYVRQSSKNNKMDIIKVKDFLKDTPRPINKCLLVGDPEKVPYWEDRIAKAMRGKMHVCHSTPYFIELLPLGIDKGPSLQKLLAQFGLTPSELMTFGDSFNDLSMIKLASIGIAMGNAEQPVKDAADYITDTNNNDGIAKALSHFSNYLP